MGLFDIFKKKKEKTLYDELEEITVKAFRGAGELNGVPPTKKTSDEEILKIYKLTLTEYRKVEGLRNEKIPAKCLNMITLHFLQVYEQQGVNFFNEHLKYELDKYVKEGLRDYQKQGIELF